ncbi:hypothetical protein LTR86_011311 [Recurvomyces mirabilis]|nr:hypothetical protein LTR86_011311 [Recurvomyces mirabilis]
MSAEPTFRRPTTVNANDFWYISLAAWNAHLSAAGGTDVAAKKAALNNLRKYDTAGRIMETDEGVPAPNPCSWCTRGGNLGVECKVFGSRDDIACAYCKRMGKSGCTAKEVVEEGATRATSEQRVAALETELAAEKVKVVALETSLENAQVVSENLRLDMLTLREELQRQSADMGVLRDRVMSVQLETQYSTTS